jgi:hypothetical protein
MTAPPLSVPTSYGRGYTNPLTGETVVSVTTAIDRLSKPALQHWYAKCAAQYAVAHRGELDTTPVREQIMRIRGAAETESELKADLGTRVHEAVELACVGFPWRPGPEVAPFLRQFELFRQRFAPTNLRNEVTVWNHSAGYAGTADLFCDIDGSSWLVDVKSGRGVYPQVALQLAALANAECVVDPSGAESPMPVVHRLGVLHLRPRSWSLIPVTPTGESFAAFLALVQLTGWERMTAPYVLGEAL